MRRHHSQMLVVYKLKMSSSGPRSSYRCVPPLRASQLLSAHPWRPTRPAGDGAVPSSRPEAQLGPRNLERIQASCPKKRQASPLCLFPPHDHGRSTRNGSNDLLVLLRQDTGHPDRTDDAPLVQERHAPLHHDVPLRTRVNVSASENSQNTHGHR